MGGTFSRSWAMTKESWAVLRADKTLVLFPAISSVALLLVLATFAVPTALTLMDAGVFNASRDQVTNTQGEVVLPMGTRVLLGVIAFAFYFVSFTVMNFFNVALVGAAMERFEGRDAGVRVGLGIAVQRIPQILLWSLVAATVGMILKAIEERVGIFGKIVVTLIGAAWAIASFFVVPVLAAEGVGPLEALKRSVSILKRSWGEAAVTRIGVGIVFSVAILLVLGIASAAVVAAVVSLQSPGLAIAIGFVAVIAVIALMLLSTTLQSIVQAAVYRYAAQQTVAPGFSSQTLRGVFMPKSK